MAYLAEPGAGVEDVGAAVNVDGATEGEIHRIAITVTPCRKCKATDEASDLCEAGYDADRRRTVLAGLRDSPPDALLLIELAAIQLLASAAVPEAKHKWTWAYEDDHGVLRWEFSPDR